MSFPVNAIVYAQWTDGLYYKAKVIAVKGISRTVQFVEDDIVSTVLVTSCYLEKDVAPVYSQPKTKHTNNNEQTASNQNAATDSKVDEWDEDTLQSYALNHRIPIYPFDTNQKLIQRVLLHQQQGCQSSCILDDE